MTDIQDSGTPSSAHFAVKDYLFYLFAQVNSHYDRGIEDVLKPTGLNKTKWRILMSLREQNGASITDISEMTSIKRSTISRTADAMEKEGLIHRKANEKDNRVTEVFLDDKGAEALEKIISVIGKQYHRAISGIEEQKLHEMKATLLELIANLKRSPLE